MMRWFSLIAVALCLWLGANVQPARAETRVRVVLDAGYPPYMFGSTQPLGLYPEIIRRAFAGSCIRAEVAGYPWRRALQLARAGQAIVGGIYHSPDRMKQFYFSAPFYRETLVVAVKEGRKFPFETIGDLGGRRVGINRGWSYGESFDSARREGLIVAEETADNMANMKKLLLDRIDCIIIDAHSLAMLTTCLGLENAVVSLERPVAVNSVHLAVAKTRGQVRLLERFDAGLARLQASGDYARLVKRHMERPGPH